MRVSWTTKTTPPGGTIASCTTKVEITGTTNIYRNKNGTNSYQTYFASEASKAGTAQTVTIKITINKID